MQDTLLSLQHISKNFGEGDVLRDISLDVARGEFVTLLGAQDAPHVVNLAVAGLRSQGLINALQDRDICVSAGSACSKGHRSHVLEAMGVDPALIDGSIRISLSGETTEAEVDALLNALPQAVDALRPSRGKHPVQ